MIHTQPQRAEFRPLTNSEMTLVAGGDGEYVPNPWDHPQDFTIEIGWDAEASAMTTTYYDINTGWFKGVQWDYIDTTPVDLPDYGYFLNGNIGDVGLVGATVAWSPNSGIEFYVDLGVGSPGVTAGYTNSLSGYLTDFSAQYNYILGNGEGFTFDPFDINNTFQNGATTYGSPGLSVTYGWEVVDLLNNYFDSYKSYDYSLFSPAPDEIEFYNWQPYYDYDYGYDYGNDE